MVAVRKEAPTTTGLRFSPLTLDDIPSVRPVFETSSFKPRTCDFSVGGLFMWIDYFRYSFAMADGFLYVMGLNEKDLSTAAFSLPCGAGPLGPALRRLRDYCTAHGMKCVLSAVPENALDAIAESCRIEAIEPLDDWSDYLYDIDALATLSGKHLGKKRNHVNRFMAENPGYRFEPLDASNIEAVRDFFLRQHLDADKPMTADYERLQVEEVLDNPDLFGFDGAVLTAPGHGVVAFTMGEPIDDTLFVHIEKMDHTINGSGETINKLYAESCRRRFPTLRYINREEDAGDPGLRKAKLSYSPAIVLRKFNVTLA